MKEIAALVAALCVALAFVVGCLFYYQKSELETALTKNYQSVQIKISFSTDYKETTESEADVVSSEDSQEYYTEYTDEPDEKSSTTDITVKMDGDIYFESGDGFQRYYYIRDNVQYVKYLTTDLVQGKDSFETQQVWTEMTAEDFGRQPSFSFDVFDGFKNEDFVENGKFYEPNSQTLSSLFYDFLQIDASQRYKYVIYDMKFAVSDKKLQTVTVEYENADFGNITQQYDFSYDNEQLKIPES